MSVDTRLPAADPGTIQSFGSASVRLLAPQCLFEIVRSHVAQTGGGSDRRAMAGAVTADAIRGQSERATPAEQRRLTFRLDQLAARVGSATPAVPRLLQDAMTLEVVAMNSSQHVPATWRPPRELEALL